VSLALTLNLGPIFVTLGPYSLLEGPVKSPTVWVMEDSILAENVWTELLYTTSCAGTSIAVFDEQSAAVETKSANVMLSLGRSSATVTAFAAVGESCTSVNANIDNDICLQHNVVKVLRVFAFLKGSIVPSILRV
jgi:hypothetical protein